MRDFCIMVGKMHVERIDPGFSLQRVAAPRPSVEELKSARISAMQITRFGRSCF